MIKTIQILTIVLAASACQSIQGTKSSGGELYSEDLGPVMPEYQMPEDTIRNTGTEQAQTAPDVIPSGDVTFKLNDVLDRTDDFRKSVNAIDGFTIQVYSGTSSDDARKIRGKLLSLLPGEDAELFYDEPNFKVKVGAYFTRLEAQKSFNVVNKEFPNAIIIPDRIAIDRDESDN